MKEKPKKQFTELSDQELEKVNGGGFLTVLTPSCDVTKCIKLGKKTDSKTCECI